MERLGFIVSSEPNRPKLRELFDRSVESPEERQAILNSLADDSPVKKELESLLAAHDASKGFLNVGASPETFVPFQFDKYSLLERIGRGGMAEVYRAKVVGPAGFEKQVAVKRILMSFVTQPGFLQLFENEARLNSLLSHPNIVQVYDFIRNGDNYLLVLEYVKGRTLAAILARALETRRTMFPYAALHIAREICEALDYAYRKPDETSGAPLRLIHRDVAPKNIMLTNDGDIKVLDFGIAKALSQISETQIGTLKGTPGYMSPEQAVGIEVDHRSDLFNVGINLYEMVSGERLFQGMSLAERQQEFQEDRIEARVMALRCSASVKRILTRALKTFPEERFESGAEFANEIRNCMLAEAPHFSKREVASWVNVLFSPEFEGTQTKVSAEPKPIALEPQVILPAKRTPRPALTELRARPLPPPSRQITNKSLVVVVSVVICMILGARVIFDRRASVRPRVIAEAPSLSGTIISTPSPSAIPTPAQVVKEKKNLPIGICSATITSSPPGASLAINDVFLGTTPLVASVPCGRTVKCRLELPGYLPAIQRIVVNSPDSEVAFTLENDSRE